MGSEYTKAFQKISQQIFDSVFKCMNMKNFIGDTDFFQVKTKSHKPGHVSKYPLSNCSLYNMQLLKKHSHRLTNFFSNPIDDLWLLKYSMMWADLITQGVKIMSALSFSWHSLLVPPSMDYFGCWTFSRWEFSVVKTWEISWRNCF